MNLVETIRGRARDYESGMALIFEESSWTNSEFDQVTDHVGRSLMEIGVRPGDRVAIVLGNTPELAFCYYGCFKIGAIAVPINNRFAEPELEYTLNHCQARVCITQPDLYERIESIRRSLSKMARFYVTGDHSRFNDVLSFNKLSDASTSEVSFPEYSGDAVSAILYTSGTTSRPKGVTHTHRTLKKIGEYHAEQLHFSREDAIAVLPPMSHILGLTYLLSAMHSGGTAHIIPSFDPERVLNLISNHRITRISGLPVMFNAMVNHPSAATTNLSSLKSILVGGDAVPPALQEEFETKFGVPILEGCGMTEIIPYAINTVDARKPGSIGRAALGVHLRLVDDDGNDVPDSEVGELWAKSDGAMIGYWENPEATAAGMHESWIRTGDRARCDSEGFYWFMGRMKEIIIRAGSNISPQEVEEVMYDHPAVREAGVIGVPHPELGEAVWAFVALRAGHEATTEEIQSFMEGRIAAYKIPERIQFLDDLPKGPTGKVQRRALKERTIIAEEKD